MVILCPARAFITLPPARPVTYVTPEYNADSVTTISPPDILLWPSCS